MIMRGYFYVCHTFPPVQCLEIKEIFTTYLAIFLKIFASES